MYSSGTGFRIARQPDTVRAPDAAFLRAEGASNVEDVIEIDDVIPGWQLALATLFD